MIKLLKENPRSLSIERPTRSAAPEIRISAARRSAHHHARHGVPAGRGIENVLGEHRLDSTHILLTATLILNAAVLSFGAFSSTVRSFH
jgi:hypothetical protein